MQVLKPGSAVTIANGQIRGHVVQICIQTLRVSYEVAWWDGRTRCTAWLGTTEMSREDDESEIMQIGFHGTKGKIE